jgi:predicted dehydrogenase
VEVIRVGVVGAGANTVEKHIPNLQAIEGVEIVSVCNRTRESSERVAKQFHIPKVYDNWRELVDAPDTNAIVIGTWPYMHCPVTLAALQANKHVMTEARMAMNLREARQMLEAAKMRPHLVVQVVPSPFTLRVDNTIKRLIAEGYLGDILAIEVRAGGTFIDRDSPLHWRQDFDLSGFNTMTLGIWYEAVMRWVGEAKRVTALGKTFVPMRRDASGNLKAVRIPDHLEVVAEMACGAIAHFQISAITGLAGGPEAWLFGSEGTLRLADGRLFGGRRGDSALTEIPVPPEEEGKWRVEEEFVNAIRGKEKIQLTTFEDGVKYMEFTEAAIRSMAEGRTVAIGDLL